LELKNWRKFHGRGMVMKNKWLVVSGMILGLATAGAMAAGGGNVPAEGVNYIEITPPLIVNYGGPGKVRYIKAELSLRTENAADATEVIHHLPLIRDRLVSILSAQTEEVISTAEGKEYLRIYALAEINKALLKVEGRGHDGNDGGERPEKETQHSSNEEITSAQGAETTLPSAADVKPVKGPASDLFFNNFVVQK
jgi:flagellar basal body-associated protein FliL